MNTSCSCKPFQGTSLGNNIFKIRLAVKSKNTGKRGGARVITFVRVLENEILMISIYDKADQENMTSKEINEKIKRIFSDFFDKNLNHFTFFVGYLLMKFAHAFF